MTLMHNQSSLQAASKYLEQERNLPAMAGMMEEIADDLGDSQVQVCDDWQRDLESPISTVAMEAVLALRKQVPSRQEPEGE